MHSYKECKDPVTNDINQCIKRVEDGAIIPFAPDNTDYANFKIDLANGAELSDANNTVMTANQISAFIATLP